MEQRRINLALQGGGAHGAFTWGVLDRLLDETWLDFAAISGTSAGAMNGAALQAGLAAAKGRSGRRAARENMAHIWSEIGQVSDSRVVRWLHSFFPTPRSMERVTEVFSPFAWFENLTRLFSPYDYGPFYANPLRIVLKTLPYPKLGLESPTKIFVNATNVRTGLPRVFSGAEVTVDAVLASACLPTIYRAVEIHDPATGQVEEYWDGGYSGNPSLWPLYEPDLPRDIVIVNINPMRREAVPHTPAEIADRVNEISFNAALLSELRAINFVKRLHAEGRLQGGRVMKNVLVHMIMDDALMNDLNARSKVMPDPGMLTRMFEAGQAAAHDFIENHADNIGRRDLTDLSSIFLPPAPGG